MIQSGRVVPDATKYFRDYINEELSAVQDSQIDNFVAATGVDVLLVKDMLKAYGRQGITDADLHRFGYFDKIRETVDSETFAKWLKLKKNLDLLPIGRNWAAQTLLMEFFKRGGRDISEWDASEFE